jgi:hypothetical protein
MNKLDLVDLHTQLLNRTYSLYLNKFRSYALIANFGYFGNPDPTLKIPKGTDTKDVTPDFIATDKKEIVQILDIKGFDGMVEWSNDDEIIPKIEKEFLKCSEYRKISPESIKSYFSKYDIVLNSITLELIVVVEFEFHSRYFDAINKAAEKNGIIVWSIDLTQKRLRKHIGHHLDQKLDRLFNPDVVLSIYSWFQPLVLFTRQTKMELKIFYFTSNLISALVQDSKSTIRFDEIDKIMTDSDPPKFAHLIPKEREQQWKSLLYETRKKRTRVLKPSTIGPDIYELENVAILENPYSQHKLLDDLAKELRIVK